MSRLLVAQRALTVPGWAKDALWRRARAVPSLDLRFADNKSLVDAVTGASLVTFTRAGSGTYTDSAGVLQTAVTNLVLRSEEFDTSWVRFGTTTLTTNTVTAPNGTLTADNIVFTSASAGIYQSVTGLASTTYTFSIWIKSSSSTQVRIVINTNLSDPVIQTVTVTSAWQRFNISKTTSAGTNSVTAQVQDNGSGGTQFDLWGAQLEQSATVGEYIPTTSTINSAPRFDHSITSSTTNLVLRSEEFDTTWSVIGTVTANAITAPNGTVTADLITTNGTSAQPFQGVTISSGATITGSCFLKPNGINETEIVLLSNNNTTPYARATFNISTGVISVAVATANGGTSASANIQAFANGWYRCSVTVTYPAVTLAGIRINATGATGGIYLWGAQLEQSSTAGPYVPTTTAAATSNTTESLGLLVEEQRTNSITNNTMVGAVAGTPGTSPTGWIYATTSSNGLTLSIVGTGVENGINYIDYRFNGTTVASPNACSIGFANAAAVTGQTWTASIYWKLVAGSATGLTNWQLGIIENTAGGVFVTGAFYSQTAPTSAALITQRPAATRTLSGGATVGLVTYPMSINVAGNTAIDFTIRIGLPQLEQGAFATSPILTSTAAATRNADVASITGSAFSGWYNAAEGSIFTNYRSFATAAFPDIFNISDGTNPNRQQQFIDGSNGFTTFRELVSNTQQGIGSQALTLNGEARSVGAYSSIGLVFTLNGLVPSVSANATHPTGLNRLSIGSSAAGNVNYINGHIRRLCYWNQRLPNSTLQGITQ